jgi:hypothetical protein
MQHFYPFSVVCYFSGWCLEDTFRPWNLVWFFGVSFREAVRRDKNKISVLNHETSCNCFKCNREGRGRAARGNLVNVLCKALQNCHNKSLPAHWIYANKNESKTIWASIKPFTQQTKPLLTFNGDSHQWPNAGSI